MSYVIFLWKILTPCFAWFWVFSGPKSARLQIVPFSPSKEYDLPFCSLQDLQSYVSGREKSTI